MPSPFPGMDPYLEAHWGDVHTRLIVYACDQLREHLPGDLLARVEERVFVEPSEGQERLLVPDVRVVERRGEKPKPTPSNSTVTLAQPYIVRLSDPFTEGFIEIRERGPDRRLVTVIEVLSLTNKAPGEGRQKFKQKQQELRDAGVSLVEIDLLRDGSRMLPMAVEYLPVEYRTPYGIVVRRGWKPVDVEIYRLPLREGLPVFGIPLRETDADAPLDLQALIEQCYRNGNYDSDIDYNRDPDPPLDKADARWADRLLKQTGRRMGKQRQKRRT